MGAIHTNNAAATLASSLTNVATSLTLASGTGALFPSFTTTGSSLGALSDYFNLTLTQTGTETSWEVVKVTARTGDVLTISRGREGTTAVAWASGSKAELRLTSQILSETYIQTPTNSIYFGVLDGATNVDDPGMYMEWSAFASNSSSTQTYYHIQLSTTRTFSTILYSSEYASTSLNYVTLPNRTVTGVLASTNYFWRARFRDSRGYLSAWSAPSSFTTAAVFSQYVLAPAATPATVGTSFLGGWYVGMVWHRQTLSQTYMAVGTGYKTFTIVTNQAVTPLFYIGQTVDVRDYSGNLTLICDGNKMSGTIVSCSGYSVTVNVATSTGSGSYGQWAFMVQARIILAPKASGDFTTQAFPLVTGVSAANMPNNTTWSTGGEDYSGQISNGYIACNALRAATTSATHPAVHKVATLTIGGYTDWYMPAIDELTLITRKFKPTAGASDINGATNRTQLKYYGTYGGYSRRGYHGHNTASIPNFPGNCSYGDTTWSQTTAGASFVTGGSECLENVYYAVYRQAATGGDGTTYYYAQAVSGTEGEAAHYTANAAVRWRAVRRSII